MKLDVYGDTLCALVSAAALASTGNDVVLHVPDMPLLQALSAGECPFREPDLPALLLEQQQEGRLVFVSVDQPPADDVSVVFISLAPSALPLANDIVRRFAALPSRSWLLVNQSTFAVGTTDSFTAVFQQSLPEKSDARFVSVSLPDVLQEGAALQNFTRPAHFVLGCNNAAAEKLVKEVLRPFNRRRDGILTMLPSEAEFTKLAINGMLATRLSFMNEMANLADVFGVDIEKVRQGLGADGRIGDAYLYPGCGFGGLSFSRDLMSLVDTLASSGVASGLLHQVLAINEHQKEVLFRKLWQHYDRRLENKTVTIWGAAFKPNTHRIENAPALRLIDALLAQGASLRIHDPQAMPALAHQYMGNPNIEYFNDEYDAAKGADALMLVTEWKCYWQPDFIKLKSIMKTPLLLDGRNIYGPEYVREHGFEYYGVGRG